MIDDHLTESNFELQPEHIECKCLVNDQCKEVVACNDIIDCIEANQTWPLKVQMHFGLEMHQAQQQKGACELRRQCPYQVQNWRNCLAAFPSRGQSVHLQL